MNAAQANLYVTGHNMANVNNVGYTRQQVIQADHFSNSVGRNASGLMQVGLGANIQSIRQIRDKYLDMAYRSSAATMGYYSVSYNVGRVVESTIGELEGEYKLQSVLRDLKNHIAELHNNMAGVETRGEFISSCVSFVDKSADTYDNLIKQQENLNENIMAMTKRVNELIADINYYSRQIYLNEITGDSANDYRDIVNSALDELSSYLDIDYTIKSDFSVSIYSEGKALLVNGHQNMLGLRYCAPDSNFVEVVVTRSTEILKYDDIDAPLFFRYNKDINPLYGNDGGALKGLLVSRGLRSVTYVDSEAQIKARYGNDMDALYARADGLGVTLAPGMSYDAAIRQLRDELNSLRADPLADPDDIKDLEKLIKDMNMTKLQYDRDIFNVRNCTIPKTQLQLDTLVNAVVKLVNDTLAPVVEKPPAGSGIYVKASDYPYGQDGSQQYIPIFVRKNDAYHGKPVDPDNPNGQWEVLGEDANDPFSLFTIGNFIVNPVLRSQAGYKLITLSSSGDMEDHRLLADLLRKWDSRLVGVDKQVKVSVEEFYSRMVSGLGVEVQRYKKATESEAEVLAATDNKRMSMSGVALDEEMANMLRFQHAYQASARIFNYIDSMIDKLINGTGRVGL
jgi:flagellar hook-associated protein 1 FlgK